MKIEGICDPRFISVREQFERNFSERGELGASVCVMINGEPVVDLWGGVANKKSGKLWEEDTLVVVMSSSKGVTALCGNILIDRGLLDLEAPVSKYWPEFGKKGKSDIPVRMLFSHQSGVSHYSGISKKHAFADWDWVINRIEHTRPFWKPGTRVGYHGLTQGWLIGELVKRVTGKSIGQFLREEVCEPLNGLDLWMGLPEELESRVADFENPDFSDPDLPATLRFSSKIPQIMRATLAQIVGRKYPAIHILNDGGFFSNPNLRIYRAAEIPAAGVITNARGLAGLYAPLSMDGAFGGTRLVSQGAIAGMKQIQSATDSDAVLSTRTNFTLGFSKSWSNENAESGLNSVIIGEDAFGTSGFGGSLGFADPYHKLSFSYTMNQPGLGTGLNPRGQSLVDSVYKILGAPSKRYGFWANPH